MLADSRYTTFFEVIRGLSSLGFRYCHKGEEVAALGEWSRPASSDSWSVVSMALCRPSSNGSLGVVGLSVVKSRMRHASRAGRLSRTGSFLARARGARRPCFVLLSGVGLRRPYRRCIGSLRCSGRCRRFCCRSVVRGGTAVRGCWGSCQPLSGVAGQPRVAV